MEKEKEKGVADTEVCQGRTEILRAGQLLPPVHRRICKGSKTITRLSKKSKEGVYQAIEITTDITGVLCAKERWKEEDGIRLEISEQLDNQEQLSTATDFGSDRQYQKEESVYKDGFEVEL